ncbi:MAG: flavodoxin family protein [Xanthomonadales bacterium]
MRILAINGSYRSGGITDQTLEVMGRTLRDAGHEFVEIPLRDRAIHFCLNCRECTQQPGPEPGHCVQDDAMAELVEQIEACDACILASPTNCGAVTAVFKRFMERLIVYAYWPWDRPAPKLRRPGGRKPTLLVSSSAAPGFMGRWLTGTIGQLRQTANMLGGRVRGTCFTGLAATAANLELTVRQRRRAARLARRLMTG